MQRVVEDVLLGQEGEAGGDPPDDGDVDDIVPLIVGRAAHASFGGPVLPGAFDLQVTGAEGAALHVLPREVALPLEGAQVTLRYGDVTSQNVTLIITDPVSRDVKTVTREIAPPAVEAPAAKTEEK